MFKQDVTLHRNSPHMASFPFPPQTPDDFEEQGTQLQELGLLRAAIFEQH